MIYLGKPGRMVGLRCPSSQRVSADDGYRFSTTLEGRRKAQVVPGQRRVWDLATGQLTTPSQVAAIQEFASGEWGKGPFWFVPAEGPLVNVMDAHAMVTNFPTRLEPGGPMLLEDGTWAGDSVRLVSGAFIDWHREVPAAEPPVLPGVPITASAYVEGDGAYIMVQWYDASGGFISPSVSSPQVEANVGTRVHVTAHPPEGAVQLRLTARNVTRSTRPAVTWTNELTEWGRGVGAHKVVLSSFDSDLVRAVPKTVLSSTSFTVMEVG